MCASAKQSKFHNDNVSLGELSLSLSQSLCAVSSVQSQFDV